MLIVILDSQNFHQKLQALAITKIFIQCHQKKALNSTLSENTSLNSNVVNISCTDGVALSPERAWE